MGFCAICLLRQHGAHLLHYGRGFLAELRLQRVLRSLSLHFTVPNLDLPAMCSPKFKPGPPTEEAQVLSDKLNEAIVTSVSFSSRFFHFSDFCPPTVLPIVSSAVPARFLLIPRVQKIRVPSNAYTHMGSLSLSDFKLKPRFSSCCVPLVFLRGEL